jgi:hypothetical protein
MHFFWKEMKSTSSMSWKDSANGMWYVEDYVRFFEMLKTLEVPAEVKPFIGSRCWFTSKTEDDPQEKPEVSLGRAKASTDYRLRLHNSNLRPEAILKDKELIDIFWQSSPTENLYTRNSITITTGKDLVTTTETLFKDMNQGSASAKRAYESIISTLLQYIQENKIVVPIPDETGKKMFYGIVTDKVDGEDEYTVKFIGFDDEAYSGVKIWGLIYQYF